MSRMLGSGENMQGEVLLDPVDLPEAQKNPLLMMHQLLRGRYVWAISTGLLLAVVAAVCVYNLPIVKPIYKSEGLVQIKPALDPLLYQTSYNKRIADYDQFLESQVPMIRSQRIILMAMSLTKEELKLKKEELNAWDDRNWADVVSSWGRMDPDEQVAQFSQGLSVEHPGNTQNLSISFQDTDPVLAPVAVKLVIAAYKKIYDVDVMGFARRMTILTDKERELTNRVKQLEASVKVAAGEYGSEEFLARSLELKQSELLMADQGLGGGEMQVKNMAMNSLRGAQALFAESKIKEASQALGPVLKVWPDVWPNNNDAEELRQQIAEKGGPEAGGAAGGGPAPMIELTPELAAATDELMKTYLQRRDDAQHQLELNKTRFAEQTPVMRTLREEVRICQKEIDDRLAKLKSQMTGPGAGADGRLTLTEANDRLRMLRERRRQLSEDTKRLQGIADQVRHVSAELQSREQELERVKNERNKLEFEGVTGGRTEVISPGDKPLRAFKDRRRPITIAAAFGGLALGMGIFLLVGLMDRRVRTIADARDSLDGSNRILGILPALPDNFHDPEQASAVAFAVHHVRTLLQLGGGQRPSTVFAVTSASPQDGKTSLTLALGMSYATSGARTLLIDADVIGGGLSARLGSVARPRLGAMLLRKGHITREQMDEGLREAQRTSSRIGQTLVKLGYATAADAKQTLIEQETSVTGFLDMLDGLDLADCTATAGTPNLSVMPVGNMGVNHIGQLSVDAVRRIIEQARTQYDVVIFDTGPLLGSLEAGIVTATVDEVIVAVSRGQQRPLLDQTFARLRELGARLAGIVFNRANIRDIERSGYASSMTSQRPPMMIRAGEPATTASERIGPIARALLDSGKPANEEK